MLKLLRYSSATLIGTLLSLIVILLGAVMGLLFWSISGNDTTTGIHGGSNVDGFEFPMGQAEQDKRSMEKSCMVAGEDATSGFYYTVYRRGEDVQHFREVWNGGAIGAPHVMDFIFKDGVLARVNKSTIGRDLLEGNPFLSHYNQAPVETLIFEGPRMTGWNIDGSDLFPEDPQWFEKERATLLNVKALLEAFKSRIFSEQPC